MEGGARVELRCGDAVFTPCWKNVKAAIISQLFYLLVAKKYLTPQKFLDLNLKELEDDSQV